MARLFFKGLAFLVLRLFKNMVLEETASRMFCCTRPGKGLCTSQFRVGMKSCRLDYFPWPSSSSTSTICDVEVEDNDDVQCLKHVDLKGWPKIKSLPEQLQHLSALTYLEKQRAEAPTKVALLIRKQQLLRSYSKDGINASGISVAAFGGNVFCYC
ncbi:hypothetical protein LguiB_012583 [Lonicera macranthoides]